MINNNLTIDSPDCCRHKNVLNVVSGSEFLRSIVMRDILKGAWHEKCKFHLLNIKDDK